MAGWSILGLALDHLDEVELLLGAGVLGILARFAGFMGFENRLPTKAESIQAIFVGSMISVIAMLLVFGFRAERGTAWILGLALLAAALGFRRSWEFLKDFLERKKGGGD